MLHSPIPLELSRDIHGSRRETPSWRWPDTSAGTAACQPQHLTYAAIRNPATPILRGLLHQTSSIG